MAFEIPRFGELEIDFKSNEEILDSCCGNPPILLPSPLLPSFLLLAWPPFEDAVRAIAGPAEGLHTAAAATEGEGNP